MRWVRPARLPLLIAWSVIIGVLFWMATQPHLTAPYASRLVSRHLLRLEEGGLRVRDFRLRLFEGIDLYGVSLTLPGSSGGMTLASADTVIVDFSLREIFEPVPRLRRVLVSNPEMYSRSGRDTTKASGHWPDELPHLNIQNLQISRGYLEFSRSDGRLAERISSLAWRGSVRSGNGLQLVLHGCNVEWDTHTSTLTGLRGGVGIDGLGIRAEGVSGRLNGHEFHLSGFRGWDDEMALTVSSRGLSITEVEELIDQSIGFQATGDIYGSLVARGDTLHFEGVFDGLLGGYEMVGLRGRAVITRDQVLLQDLEGRVNGAGFTGVGVFDLTDPRSVSFVLEGDVQDVNVADGLVPDEDDLPQTDGHGHLRIEHTDNPMWTRVVGYLRSGFIEIMPFDSCHVDIEAAGDSVVFKEVDLVYRDLSVVLDGVSAPSRIFRGNLQLESTDLASLPEGWQWPPLGGLARGQGYLSGAVDSLQLTGWLNYDDFVLGPVTSGRGEIALMVDDVLEDFALTAEIEGRELAVSEVPFGNFLLRGAASTRFARVDSFRSVMGDTTVSLSLQAALTDSTKNFLVDAFSIGLEGTAWIVEEPVTFSLGDGHFSLPSLRLTSAQGALAAGGLYERDHVVAGSLELRHFDLGLLNPFLPGSPSLSGHLTADVVVGGEPEAPVVNLIADLVDAPFELAAIDSLHVAAAFSRGSFDFEELDLHSDYGRVQGSGTVAHAGSGPRNFWPGAQLDLELRIEDGDWTFLDQFAIPALDRLSGMFDGVLEVSGTTDDPLIEGHMRSTPFHIHWLHLDELEGRIWVDSQELVLADLRGNKLDLDLEGRVELPLEFDLLSEPVSPPDGPFYMELEIPDGSNLAPLAQATNAFVTASGTGGGQVIISGPLEHPLFQGSVEIRGGGFVLRDLQEVYHDVSCDGTFSGDNLILSNVSGAEGSRGTFTGEGLVVFRGLELETFDLHLGLDRFLVASIPDLRVLVKAEDGRMTGVRVGPDSLLVPQFSGNIEVLRARYTGDFSEKPGARDPMQATVAPDWLADLKLHASPRTARIVNRDMELYLGGDLDLIRDETGIYLRGTLDVNSGRLIVFNNTFDVQQGRLDFSREVGFDPRINLDAETRYRLRSRYSSNSIIEHIGVHVGGSLFSPQVTFSSERGYSHQAIQRMLLGLEPHATPEGDAQALRSTSISAGLNVLEREIARELDIFDTFEINQIQRQSEAGGTGVDPLIGVGKFIGSDLYLKYAQGIRQDDRDFLIEYQINQHLLLQSEVRRRIDENQGQSTYNLDLKYRFEY